MNDDRFHQVPVNFVHQRAMREMGDAEARLALYLVMSEHANAIGCYRLPLGYVAADLGWTPDAAQAALGGLIARLWVAYDETSEWVFIPARLATMRPTNSKHGAGLQKHAMRVPARASFYAQFVQRWNAAAEGFPDWLKPLGWVAPGPGGGEGSDSLSEGLGDKERKNREQYQDQQPDPEVTRGEGADVVTLPGIVVQTPRKDARQGAEQAGKSEPTGNGGPGGRNLSDLVWERWRANVTAYAMQHGAEGQRVKFSGSLTARRKDLTVAGQQLLDYWDEKMRADPQWMQARKRASA